MQITSRRAAQHQTDHMTRQPIDLKLPEAAAAIADQFLERFKDSFNGHPDDMLEGMAMLLAMITAHAARKLQADPRTRLSLDDLIEISGRRARTYFAEYPKARAG